MIKDILIILFLVPNFICSQNFINNDYLKDSLTDGTYTDYWKNGNIKVQSTIKNYNLDGLFISYHRNGEIMNYLNFVEGKINDTVKKFNKKGLLTSISFYIMDTLISYKQLWYKKRKIDYVRYVEVSKENKKIPDYKSLHYRKGVIYFSPEKTINSLKTTGYSLSFFENGKIDTKEPLINNIAHGNCVAYYDNGEKAIEYFKSNGKISGEMIYYSPEGTIWKTEIYKDGKKIKTNKL